MFDQKFLLLRFLLSLLFFGTTHAAQHDKFSADLSLGVFDQENDEGALPLSLPEDVEVPFLDDNDLIGGVLSPLNGLPCVQEIDLIARGAENVLLSRRYLATQTPHHYSTDPNWEEYFRCQFLYKHIRGWTFLPHLSLRVIHDELGKKFRFTHPSGTTLDFRITKNTTVLAKEPYGISNHSEGLPNGKNDVRNTKIECSKKQITVIGADGTKFYYKKDHGKYLLQKEIRLNGKIWRYKYTSKGAIQRIESLDPNEELIYASIDIEGAPTDTSCSFSTHSSQTASYSYFVQKLEAEGKTKKKGSSHKSKISCYSRPLLTAVNSPLHPNVAIEYDSSFLLQNYGSSQSPFKCSHQLFKKKADLPHFYRVNKFMMPVGEGNAWHSLCEMTYDSPVEGKKEGTTTVTNSDGTKIIYEFTKNLLLKSKKIFDTNQQLKKEKIFEWTDDNKLTSIEWRNGEQSSFLKKSYVYDRFGNPTLETIEGDLTGNQELDSLTITRKFSEDGFHLILKEEKEGEPSFEYSYLPGTNLLTGQLTKEGDQILLRKFHIYDEWNNLVQKISDNGSSNDKNDLSGVTQRTIVHYQLRKEPPHLHMVDWIEEKYLENGEEKLLKKTHLSYDANSQVVQEDIYDANNNFSYSLYKAYNAQGKLIEESNPIGQKAFYTYNERGDLIKSIPFSNRLNRELEYDLKGRLIHKQEIGDDGVSRNFFYKYDPQGRLIYQQDYLNNITEYAYDLVVNKAQNTKLPSIHDVDDEIPILTHSSFDPWGREIEKWDARGNKTIYSYNAYGEPTEVIHPDGSKEKFSYSKSGRLMTSVDPDGNSVVYQRDCLGRVVLKNFLSPDGNKLASESFEYDAYHLKKWIDKEGNATSYFYDGAGRIIRKESAGKTIEYFYDALGRLSSKLVQNSLNITYTRDLLNRITEEKKSDLSGNLYSQIQYAYDGAGNLSEETRSIANQESKHSYTYDSFDRLIIKQNPLGGITRIHYEESAVNALGQKVPKKITLDEKNVATIETFDPYGKVVKKEKLRGDDHSWLSCQCKRFDPSGNLIEQKDYSSEGQPHILKYAYSSQNRITDVIRAFETPNERKTTFTYTPSGKIQSKTLPNGVVINFYYNPLGYLVRRTSSDGTIDHFFEPDLNGNIVICKDTLSGIEVKRTVDPFGNILSETLSTGLHLEKTYDGLNRPLTLEIPQAGSIQYHYNPSHLTKINRLDSEGNCLYSHTFNAYDLSGKVLEECLLGNIGTTSYSYDLEGKITSISNPFFKETYSYSIDGNMIERKQQDLSSAFRYDPLDQLITETRATDADNYAYDALLGRTVVNGQKTCLNELHELLQQKDTKLSYDLNGNLIQKDNAYFTFDPLNQLVQAKIHDKTITYLYDPLGRCIRRTVGHEVENYLYDGDHEIGAFCDNLTPKQLRILDPQQIPKTIAIELGNKPFAPITDAQGNIRLLIDPETNEINAKYDFTGFGEPLNSFKSIVFNPWRYASKRFDPDLQWIQFGKRHYDPSLARWISTDPAGFIDSTNLYQYVFNNPFRYRDPDGRVAHLIFPVISLVWGGAAGLSWLIPSWSTVVAIVAGSAAGVAYYELTKDENGAAAIAEGIQQTDSVSKNRKRDPSKCKPSPYEYPEDNLPPGFTDWVGGEKGKYHNPKTDEYLRPDVDHPDPIGPHWDYEGPKDPNTGKREQGRIYPDDTYEVK